MVTLTCTPPSSATWTSTACFLSPVSLSASPLLLARNPPSPIAISSSSSLFISPLSLPSPPCRRLHCYSPSSTPTATPTRRRNHHYYHHSNTKLASSISMSTSMFNPSHPRSKSFPLVANHIRYEGGIPVYHMSGYSKPRPFSWPYLLIFVCLLWLLRRLVVLRHLRSKYIRDNLYSDIAAFYDARSAAWESVWGEHMHHGLYDTSLHGVEAQIHTMRELLAFARTNGASIQKLGTLRILDVGCGIGGASRFLARTYGGETAQNVDVQGITLSEFQRNRATQLNNEQGLQHAVNISLQNAHATKFESDSFDLVWSLESAEHMDNKVQFVSECTRVLRPGAPFVMLAWCIRESTPPFNVDERFAIRKIMEMYCLPTLAAPSEYQTEMLRAGLVDVEIDDWTDRAKPFWTEVLKSAAFNVKGIQALLKYGWPLAKSALAARHVVKGIQLGTFRLVAFTGRKPNVLEAKQMAENKVKLTCQDEK